MKLKYNLTPEIKKLGISKVAVAEIYDVTITQEQEELEEIKKETVAEILKIDEDSLLENPILESYRELVRTIGRSLKKFPPAAESLIKSVQKTGSFPLINTAVDSYNLVVAKTFLALGVHDFDKLGKTITFRLSPGQEPFTSVGSEKIKYTQPGDFVYADENKVLAWLDSKDSELVKLSLETKNLVIIIQGTPYTKIDHTLKAAEDACQLITKFCGGEYEVGVIE